MEKWVFFDVIPSIKGLANYGGAFFIWIMLVEYGKIK